MAAQLVERQGNTVKTMCELFELPRSRYYISPKDEKDDAQAADLMVVAGQHPT
jgi:hypothetical protein